jgi:hypothetical protein
VEAQQSAHRERIGSNSPVAERQTSLVNQVVSDGNARYRNPRAFESWKVRKLKGLNLQPETFELFNRNRVVPRRNSFVPEWMKEFLFLALTLALSLKRERGQLRKEARMNSKTSFSFEAVSCLLARLLLDLKVQG